MPLRRILGFTLFNFYIMSNSLNNNRDSLSLLRYSVVGVIGTALDLLMTFGLVKFFQFNILLAASIAFLVIAFHNYCWNNYWTFRFRIRIKRKIAVKTMLVTAGGLGLTLVFMHVISYEMHIHYLEAKLVTSVIVLAWNFLMNKWWVFKIETENIVKADHFIFDVGIVIPAYNEASRITDNLNRVQNFLNRSKYNAQIIVVNDGSSDRTAILSEQVLATFPSAQVISHVRNLGKGAAIRTGVLASTAKYILIADADGSTPIEEFDLLYQELLRQKADIAIGSRYLKLSKVKLKQPFYRVLIGRVGNILIRFFVVDGIKDTQCGFKLFRGSCAHDIFSRGKVVGWGFDIEALVIARMLNLKICEVPVIWKDCPGSRLRPFRDAIKTLVELIYIKLNIWSGRYDKPM